MDNKEEYLNDTVNRTVPIDPYSKKKTFRTFDSLRRFYKGEAEYWNQCNSEPLAVTRQYYQSIWQTIVEIDRSDDQGRVEQLVRLLSEIQSLQGRKIVSSKTDLGKTVKACYDRNPDIALGFWYFLFDKRKNPTGSRQVEGAIEAYLFENQFKRLSTYKDNLYNEVKANLDEHRNEIHNIEEEFRDDRRRIAEANGKIITESEARHKKLSEEFQTELGRAKEKIASLENLYREKLRLDSPAKYWDDYKTQYRISGIIWTIIGALTVAAIVGLTLYLLLNLPDQLFTGDRISIESTIRWTVLLALMYSALFYFLRIAVKMILSSFHLCRDASERLQLTHQYLALLSESAIEDKHREIVLQSLFSRADTGILKGDSSPAMPDSLLSTIIKNIKPT